MRENVSWGDAEKNPALFNLYRGITNCEDLLSKVEEYHSKYEHEKQGREKYQKMMEESADKMAYCLNKSRDWQNQKKTYEETIQQLKDNVVELEDQVGELEDEQKQRESKARQEASRFFHDNNNNGENDNSNNSNSNGNGNGNVNTPTVFSQSEWSQIVTQLNSERQIDRDAKDNQIKLLNTQIQDYSVQIGALRSEKTTLKIDLTKLESDMKDKLELIDSLKEEIGLLKTKVETSMMEKQNSIEKNSLLQNEMNNIKDKMTNLEEKYDRKDNEVNKLRQQLENIKVLNENMMDSQRKHVNIALNSSPAAKGMMMMMNNGSNDNGNNMNNMNNINTNETSAVLEELKKMVNESKLKSDALIAEKARMVSELHQVQSQRNSLQQELTNKMEEIKGINVRYNEIDKENKSLKNELQETKIELRIKS